MTDAPGPGPSEVTPPAEPPPEPPAAAAPPLPRRDAAGHGWRWRPTTRALQWLVALVLVAGGVACVLKGANTPPDPELKRMGHDRMAGFAEVAFRVNTMRDNTRCAALAQTEQQRGRGLMGRTDLAGYDGMIFDFGGETVGTFYMKDTPLPLSIAWFDSAGRYVSSTDMEPCLDRPVCRQYAAARPYRYALEVPKGGLTSLGIGPGSVLSVGGACP